MLEGPAPLPALEQEAPGPLALEAPPTPPIVGPPPDAMRLNFDLPAGPRTPSPPALPIVELPRSPATPPRAPPLALPPPPTPPRSPPPAQPPPLLALPAPAAPAGAGTGAVARRFVPLPPWPNVGPDEGMATRSRARAAEPRPASPTATRARPFAGFQRKRKQLKRIAQQVIRTPSPEQPPDNSGHRKRRHRSAPHELLAARRRNRFFTKFRLVDPPTVSSPEPPQRRSLPSPDGEGEIPAAASASGDQRAMGTNKTSKLTRAPHTADVAEAKRALPLRKKRDGS